jgi:hypothetical protein
MPPTPAAMSGGGFCGAGTGVGVAQELLVEAQTQRRQQEVSDDGCALEMAGPEGPAEERY